MISRQFEEGGSFMRRRMRKFLPIVLLALMVQILAPVGAAWAASIAASDPLQAAFICHGATDSTGQADRTGGHQAHDGSCSLCCAAYAAASVDTPSVAVETLYRQPLRVVWFEIARGPFGSRTGSHAQARAPPLLT